MSTYSQHVTLSPQFQRSIRIDLDWGVEAALKGFVCQRSSAQVLQTMSRHLTEGQHSAFTWTGPFGGGKSFLGLLLATLLGGESNLRKMARDALGEVVVDSLSKAVKIPQASRSAKRWYVVPVAGRHADPVSLISRALAESGIPRVTKRLGVNPDAQRVLRVLRDLAEHESALGLLLIVDELGKVLEHTASRGGDVHFLQEVAEVASRSGGRLVVVGILHQAFDQYASRLGREGRDEWSKIQGRFVDIPVVAAVDEIVELTGRAISAGLSHPSSLRHARVIATAIRRNRPSIANDLDRRLDRCWPLHPVTAALLGPISKRRFGQNERSTFAFLGSSEPGGFRDFLSSTGAETEETYRPARYWDYLRVNLEPSILVSPDGHRWAQAAEAIGRSETRGTAAHVELAKSIALIDLFKNGSGLIGTRDVLRASMPTESHGQFDKLLTELLDWSIVIYRKHTESFGVFEGSDFDIEAAVARSLTENSALDVTRLTRLAPIRPILAKRHYQTTGALRWLDTALAVSESLLNVIDQFQPLRGSFGKLVLLIGDDQSADKELRRLCIDASSRQKDYPIIVGLPPNATTLRVLGRELVALESIRANYPELAGDPVARKELQARISSISGRLEGEFARAIETADWFVEGEPRRTAGMGGLSAMASDLCDRTFRHCPAIKSELVNRSVVSSNAQAGINALVEALVARPHAPAFGIEGFPAERGLYETVFRVTGLHLPDGENGWQFAQPGRDAAAKAFIPIWKAADKLLSEPSKVVPLPELMQVWSRPPFGLNDGLIGLVVLAYLYSNRTHIAIYLDGVYQPDVQTVFAHEVLRDPGAVSLRRVVGSREQSAVLESMAKTVSSSIGVAVAPEPLALGRALVKFALDLPAWSRRTAQVSAPAAKLRSVLLSASDPHKLALVDIPSLARDSGLESTSNFLSEQLRELAGAYGIMLDDVKKRFFRALGEEDPTPRRMQSRAEVVRGLTGDLRVEALTVQLGQYDGSTRAFESLLSLAINKPARDWTDLDVNSAVLALAELAVSFRKAELLAAVRDRAPTRVAIGMVVGPGDSHRTSMRTLDVSDEELQSMKEVAAKLMAIIRSEGHDAKLGLVALAQAGADLMDQVPEGTEP